MYIRLSLLVLLGALASLGTTGRRWRHLLAMMALLSLAVTASASMPPQCTRRMARTSATSVSPSAALVLY